MIKNFRTYPVPVEPAGLSREQVENLEAQLRENTTYTKLIYPPRFADRPLER